MKYRAEINIMPLKELLDPQGKTVEKNLPNVDISGVSNVRIGKRVEMVVESGSKEEAEAIVENACKNLLANVIMESYSFELIEA